MSQDLFKLELKKRVAQVFKNHPELRNHLDRFPWLTGSLGNPEAGIWFVAENPSLTMVERVTNQSNTPLTDETQWTASRGDRLFRDMLVKYGFKDAPWDSFGGWHCYISNVIKEADYAKGWRTKNRQALNKAAELWYPVFEWELKISQPRLIVVMGLQVQKHLRHLIKAKGLILPLVETIPHYSYIALRPEGKLGPMHPARVKKYDDDFARITRIFEEGVKQ